MQIPIENVYFLLCYAWDKLEEKDIVDVDPIESTTLVDLFARVLISGTNQLVRRGFDRGYVLHTDVTSRLKGRILFHQNAGRIGRSAALPCAFDEFSHDVLHNRILKSTMEGLTRADGVSPAHTETLARYCRLLSDVDDIELTSRVFGQVQLHRGNQFYRFLLHVCEILHENLLVSEREGRSRFRDFLRDDRQMAVLFENFVRNFYRQHQSETGLQAGRENIKWRWVASDELSERLLPKMQTDVSLVSAGRKIILECKYTPEATKRHYDAEKLRSAHLYQVHAYMHNLSDAAFHGRCDAIILYPSMGEQLSAVYKDGLQSVSIRTINLDQPWPAIHSDLVRLVGLN